MGNIANMSDHRPHLNAIDPVTKNVHVIPVQTIKDLATGADELTDYERPKELERALFHALYKQIEKALDDG